MLVRRYPRGAEVLPTHLSKWIVEKKMISRLQLIMITHDACVTIHKEFFPLKHSSGIQTIMDQQPEKDFVLLLTTSLPHPLQSRNCIPKIHQGDINR
jgi:hypothetical protein